MTLLDKVRIASIQHSIDTFDEEQFKINQLLLFIASDLCNTAAMDIMEQLIPMGLYKFEDKQTIEKIKKLSFSLVGDISKVSEDYACRFGDLADEVHTLVTGYLRNKELQRNQIQGHFPDRC